MPALCNRISTLVAPVLWLCAVTHAAEMPVMHEQQVLATDDPAAKIRAASIDGNTIVLGAPLDSALGQDAGAAFVFERPPGGVWVQTARLQSGLATHCLGFGNRVDVHGTTIVANHWNYLYSCIEPADARVSGLEMFERGPAGWVSTFRPQHRPDGQDLAFDGTSAFSAEVLGANVFTRAPDGSWNAPVIELTAAGVPLNDDEDPGPHLDIHNGLAAIGGVAGRFDESGHAIASLFRRDANGQWQPGPEVHNPGEAGSVSQPRIAVGPRQRLAINEFVYEPGATGNYVNNANLRPACAVQANVAVSFDRKNALALVRSTGGPSLRNFEGAVTLHLYRRISAGRWEAVAQLIPSDNSPPNPIARGGDSDRSFAIDGGVAVISNRTWDSAGPRAASYQFSSADTCAGHRGNWVELTPQRWAINNQGGARAYTITTTDYVNQSGDRPGEYALLAHNRFQDFDVSLRARSNETLSPSSAADYVVLFGYQDELNYYYMMFSRYAINNELFKVVGGVRQKIARAPRGSFLDNGWHRVDVQRRGAQIRVLFDGLAYITATDNTFGSGAVGIGSYNDAASFDDIVVRSVGAP